MKRRDLLKLAGASGGLLALNGWRGRSARRSEAEALPGQGPDPLPAATYERRVERAIQLMQADGIGALFCEPATSFEYLVGTDFYRSERLIALLIPAGGQPVIVAPSFELDRVQRSAKTVTEFHGWEEHEDPFALVADVLGATEVRRLAIEPSVRYGMVDRLQRSLPGWELADGTAIFTRLRIIKTEDELELIRRAVSITEASIAATFAGLEAGLTDRDVARRLSQEMSQRGARGGGLVQFGPTSAIPHGGTEGRPLEPGMPVLIDAGCRVHGYTSDITRMHYFGEKPSPKYREVYNTVLAAQTAAYEAGRPGLECQQLDRTARRLIAGAGHGKHFTHRLGHGIGMDGHEPPYLVEGNQLKLESGMVFTIEPGIYLPGEWGVRIEDDFVVRDSGLEPLSSRVSPI